MLRPRCFGSRSGIKHALTCISLRDKKGGVNVPMLRLTTMIPKWIGSTPMDCAIESRSGESCSHLEQNAPTPARSAHFERPKSHKLSNQLHKLLVPLTAGFRQESSQAGNRML